MAAKIAGDTVKDRRPAIERPPLPSRRAVAATLARSRRWFPSRALSASSFGGTSRQGRANSTSSRSSRRPACERLEFGRRSSGSSCAWRAWHRLSAGTYGGVAVAVVPGRRTRRRARPSCDIARRGSPATSSYRARSVCIAHFQTPRGTRAAGRADRAIRRRGSPRRSRSALAAPRSARSAFGHRCHCAPLAHAGQPVARARATPLRLAAHAR